MARPTTKCPPPPGIALSDVPTVRGRTGAYHWLNNALGVPVRLNYVRQAVARRDLKPAAEIGGALHFSTRALYEWIMDKTEEPQ